MKIKDIINVSGFTIYIKESNSCNIYEYDEYGKDDMLFDEEIKSIVLLDSDIYVTY